MAPFNQRQIGYIQAIAGRQQHRTLICNAIDETLTSEEALSGDIRLRPYTLNTSLVKTGWQNSSSTAITSKTLLMQNWILDNAAELGFDSRAVHVNSKLEKEDFENLRTVDVGLGDQTALNVFSAPVKSTFHFQTADAASAVLTATSNTGELVRNPELIKSTERATEDGFLNSTDVKFRFTLPTSVTQASANPMGQNHYEFRWIVWRAKRPTLSGSAKENTNSSNLEAIRDGVSLRNPGYDFFMGQTGRKRGFLGYTLNPDLDKEKITGSPDGEAYSGAKWSGSQVNTTGATHTKLYDDDAGEKRLTVDDLMTMRINRDDYVVMKDVRFFLGKEHGKSHYEDHLHWDWNDPIETPEDNVLTSPTLNGKNYRWHMTLFGTSGGPDPVKLLSSLRWTTKMESG